MIAKHYGVIFRRRLDLGGEFRGFVLRAEDSQDACSRGLDFLERMESEHRKNMRDEVGNIEAEPLGYIGTAECTERFDAWCQKLTDLKGSYFHITIEETV